MMYGTDRFRSLDSKKRSVVLEAAAEEFATYGYLAASTNRIAASAKISKGALFSYFPTKEMLFSGVVGSLFEHVSEEAPALVGPASGANVGEELRSVASRLYSLHQRYPRLFRLGHELRFQAKHIPDADEQVSRYRALVDGPVLAAIDHASKGGKLAVDASIAAHLVGATFDRMRSLLVLGAPEASDEATFNRAADALAGAVSRAVSR